jgi:predicted unusual protein kinase regulating ubiquinone biosynthesis (AarF/ABC1/UbiB family)
VSPSSARGPDGLPHLSSPPYLRTVCLQRSQRARSLARYLLNSILQLGPTFIKIGQLSSTRSDLFPAEFIEELSSLQVHSGCFVM